LYQEISIFNIAQTKNTKMLKAFCFFIHTSSIVIAIMQYCKCQKSEAVIYNFKMPVISKLSLVLENFPSSMWRSITVYRPFSPSL